MIVSPPLEDLDISSLKTNFESLTSPERAQAAKALHLTQHLGTPMSVGDRITLLARHRADEPGYLDATTGEIATWQDLAEQAGDWSSKFAPGTKVGLKIKSPVEFCRAYLAALASGVCIAPLDPRATGDELERLLDVLEITDLVVDRQAESEAVATGLNVSVMSEHSLRQNRRTYGSVVEPIAADVLMTTSGTTGIPKVVPLKKGQLLRVASRIAWHNELISEDRGYSPLPLCHINAQVVGVLATLVSGSSLVVEDRFHRSEFWATTEAHKVTWINLVPAIFGALCDQPPPNSRACDHIQFARSASAPLPRPVQERFESMSGIGVLDTYGMTEAASQIAANPMKRSARKPGSVGRPIGVTIRIVDDDGDSVAAGEVGNVEIDGPDVIGSYLGQHGSPILARNSSGWLHTGDVGRSDSDGFLYLEGRSDDVINRGGEKIYPREIEDLLRRNRAVADVAVVGRPHALLGAEAVACVRSTMHMDSEAARKLSLDLLDECARLLSRHKRPAAVFIVDSLPSGPTGKVARRHLKQAVTDGSIETRNRW